MQDQWQQAMRHSPMELMREMAEENMRFWQQAIGQGQPGKPEPKDSSDKEDDK